MPVNVCTEIWNVQAEVLEPVPLNLQDTAFPAYPYTLLQGTGRFDTVAMRTAVLENDYVRVRIALDLGGRIVEFLDRRTGTACLTVPERLASVNKGIRGVELPFGVQVSTCGSEMLSLSPLMHSVYEPSNDEGVGGVILGQLLPTGVDWQACFSLNPTRADLLIEVRVHNRHLLPVAADMKIRSWEAGVIEQHVSNSVRLHSLGFCSEQISFHVGPDSSDSVVLDLWDSDSVLGPRSTRTAAVRMSALTSDASPAVFESGVSLWVEGGHIRIGSDSEEKRAKVVVQCEQENALEAHVDLGPDSQFIATLDSDILDAALLREDGSEILRWKRPPFEGIKRAKSIIESSLLLAAAQAKSGMVESSEGHFFSDVISGVSPHEPGWGLESAFACARAQNLAREGKLQEALSSLERALTYNSEDQLAWWLQSALERHVGFSDDEERAGALNAQFLAPLEPMLRAEAFLSTPLSHLSEPSPLIESLARDPIALGDVVRLLLECGFIMDCVRLLEEVLRHRDSSWTRLTYAWILLSRSKMEVEAAEQLRRAESLPLEPPFPFLDHEKRAVSDLTARFPASERLQLLSKLIVATTSF